MNDDENGKPSHLAMKHEREIVALRSGFDAIGREISDVKIWLQKQERHFEVFAEEIRGAFGRMNQRNPTLYIGAITILLGVITMASGLTIFTINALNEPMRAKMNDAGERMILLEARERANFESLVRLDERAAVAREMSLRPPP